MRLDTTGISLRLIAVISSFLAGPVFGQAVDPQNLLIRNIHLVGGDDATTIVNILIEENTLTVVSKDDITPGEGVTVVDGLGGYALGKLAIGETPTLIILNLDPVENFEVLLDTADFTVFAINDGKLELNYLAQVEEEELQEEGESKGIGWRAYAPPPMAMPLTYQDSTKWNRWETRWVSGIFLATTLLDRIRWGSQDAASEAHHGDLGIYDGGEIRALRVGAIGTINFKKPWVYTVFGATNAFDKGFEVQNQEDFTFFDYRLDIPVFENVNLSVGKQKEPISMERIMSMIQTSMQERSAAADALLPSRSFGIVASGTIRDQRMTWATGVFNDWVEQTGGFSDNTMTTTGRVTWLPWISSDESNLFHLGLGLRHSNVKTGLHFSALPEFNKSPTFIDTGLIDANNSLQTVLEASWRKGPLWIGGEFHDTAVESPTLGDLDFGGYHVAAMWNLTGEMRPYNKKSGIMQGIPVAKTVNQGGKGAWEIATRFSSVNLTDGAIDGGEMDIWSLGLNWWLTPTFNVSMNYRYITLDQFGFESNSDAVMTRVLLVLE